MMAEDVLLRIGEIAAFFNVSVKAMRVYEKKGRSTKKPDTGIIRSIR